MEVKELLAGIAQDSGEMTRKTLLLAPYAQTDEQAKAIERLIEQNAELQKSYLYAIRGTFECQS